ncbi:MAG: electron transfer flavoprotein subunit alpha/FixB family protein [Pseudobdellovibrionaceae bacterium]
MSILLLAEHDGKSIKPATLNTVAAASKIGGDITVLVAGSGCEAAAKEAAQIAGVKNVLHCDDASLAHDMAEPLAACVLANAEGHSHILAPATTYGKNILPRVAAKLDVQQISDIIDVLSATSFKRPVYGGQAIATVESAQKVNVITVRSTGFDAVAATGGSASVEKGQTGSSSASSKFVKLEESKSERPELTSAKIIVSGGRGVGSSENFAIIEKLADKLGAAVGASRAAVDSGYVPNDYQVGQTGKVVAPQLYIAVGISGAIQHLAGMKDSKVIVAINKDEEAPIFQVADYGLVADLFDAVPELTDKL